MCAGGGPQGPARPDDALHRVVVASRGELALWQRSEAAKAPRPSSPRCRWPLASRQQEVDTGHCSAPALPAPLAAIRQGQPPSHEFPHCPHTLPTRFQHRKTSMITFFPRSHTLFFSIFYRRRKTVALGEAAMKSMR